MRRPTLRASTILSVTLIGLSFILLSSLAGNYFRQAALDAQVTSLSRIIEVAAQELLRDLQHNALSLGASINSSNALARALKGGDDTTVSQLLDDPFVTGFAGATDTDLMKIRIYDLNFRLRHQSRQGDQKLGEELPPHLLALAASRRGTERLKAIGGLWLSSHGPRYSVLLPMGGLRISGYTEVVFDPRYTLQAVSEMTRMPVTILLPGDQYTPPQYNSAHQMVLPIEYLLFGDDGQAAYRMVGLENIDQFNQDMLQTQWLTVIGFLTLIFGIMFITLWLLRIGLFTPLRNLLCGIEAYSQGELDTTIKPAGLAEIYTLGKTFNEMLQRIRNDIRQLENYSTIDSLTGIANRRLFDTTLEQALSHAKRAQVPLSLLYIDIDYFKHYNDHYGHPAGDHALQQVAQEIAGSARRDTDLVARIGGEEFAMLLAETELGGAYQVAERLLQAIAELAIEHRASKISDHLTLSIGIASMLPTTETQCCEYVKLADKALYRAKSEGRNRVVVAEAAAAQSSLS